MRQSFRDRVRLWLCKHFGHRPDLEHPGWCRRCGMSMTSTIGRP